MERLCESNQVDGYRQGNPVARMLRRSIAEGPHLKRRRDSHRKKTEDEVLAATKTLAVREENVMVARVTLHNMKQDKR